MEYVLGVVARMEKAFENFLRDCGKERKTTFFADLTIAELMGGSKAVKETYNRVIRAGGSDVEYMSEFVICLNQKIWQHHKNDRNLALVYNDLWMACDDYCYKHFKGKDLEYYIRYID